MLKAQYKISITTGFDINTKYFFTGDADIHRKKLTVDRFVIFTDESLVNVAID
jgi:hypothetical protein